MPANKLVQPIMNPMTVQQTPAMIILEELHMVHLQSLSY